MTCRLSEEAAVNNTSFLALTYTPFYPIPTLSSPKKILSVGIDKPKDQRTHYNKYIMRHSILHVMFFQQANSTVGMGQSIPNGHIHYASVKLVPLPLTGFRAKKNAFG